MRSLIKMATLLTLLGSRVTIAQTKGSAGLSAAQANQIVSSSHAQDTRLIGSAPIGRRQPHAHGWALLATSQPVSEIAYASGFRDYTNLARKIRHGFGLSPAAYGAGRA
jgi:methylphosphotriester-DNA--protein-cysteine methyltransferase